MNELAPDVSLTGNHDFDFGAPHLFKLIKDTTFVSSLPTSFLFTPVHNVRAALDSQ
jgi:2',3'-cyclic-nucleotide 2'-phosphodiesterase (5'-nucleotidase family)